MADSFEGEAPKPKQRQKVKDQHFVPQLYLARFAVTGGRLGVYDITSGRQFTSGTPGVAFEKYFYDIAEDILEGGAGKTFTEKDMGEAAMGSFERELDGALRLLLSEAPNVGIRADVRHRMGFSMAIQFLRTRAFRDQIRDQAESFFTNAAEDLVALSFPEKRHLSPKFTIGDDALAVMHLRAVLDYDNWKMVGKSLEEHVWLLMRSASGLSFITSDNPVSRRTTLQGRDTTGFKSKGIQVVYCISPEYALLMVERTTYKSLVPHDGDVVILSERQTTAVNEIIAANADRFIFGNADVFPSIMEFFDRNQRLQTQRWDPWRTESGSLRIVESEDSSSELSLPVEHFIDPLTIEWSSGSDWPLALTEGIIISQQDITWIGNLWSSQATAN